MSERVVQLTTPRALEQVTAQSFDRPVFIYKHSSVCSISSGTYQTFHKMADALDLPSNPFFTQIMVIENRDISDEVESLLGVRHESPQVLLLAEGKVIWHTSHFNITEEALRAACMQVRL
jgi:bacillithiol system protein YtxJ